VYYITFLIQTNDVTGLVINIEAKKTTIIARQHIAIITDGDKDIFHVQLMALRQQFYAAIGHNGQSKVIYRIILADDKVMQGNLPLPNIDLTSYEIGHYIQNSLVKTFHTKQRLCYDYQLDVGNHQPTSLTIYAYQYAFINRYIELFAHAKLNFVGITASMTEQGAIKPLSTEAFEQLATLPTLVGVNFLPWREQKQKYHRIHFLAVIAGYFILYAIIVWLWCVQAYPRLDAQLLQNQRLHSELAQKTQQLALLIKLHDTLLQRQADIARQESLKTQFTLPVDYLTLIALAVPDGIWLSALSYQANTLELKGDGFLYADILAFSNRLNQHEITRHHKIVSVKKQQYLLQFTINIVLAPENDE